jgi:uncharacterized protein YbjT (DUF2867 family)
MILITGAGGKTGRALIRALSGVESVRAFIRREGQASVVMSLGAENVVVGDLRDEAAVRSAFQDVRSVYHICPNMSADEMRIGRLILDAARARGVDHFVYHSVLHPQTEKMAHHWQKLRVEEMIFESGLPYTILQPAPYMQNLLAGWKSVVEGGLLRVPYSVHSRFSFIDLEDVAAAATILLAELDHRSAIYELAGTSPMSHADVAKVCSQVLKRKVRAEKEEIGNWRLRAEQGGASRYAVENLVRMFDYYNRWGLAGNPNVLRWLLKREPTSLETFIGRCAQPKIT